MTEEMCFQVWFCASLWWPTHKATLARRSQTSGGDVDCHKWVYSVGAELVAVLYAASVSWTWCKLQREPVQGDKERCDMGPIVFAEDQ